MSPACHPQRKHEARGLCKSCYEGIRLKGRRSQRIRTEREKEANRASARRNYWKDPGHRKAVGRAWFLRTHYNTTPAEVAQKIEQQGNACAICNVSLKRPNIDHDHETQKPRGILCGRCNVIVGVLEHELRPVAEAYIESWQ